VCLPNVDLHTAPPHTGRIRRIDCWRAQAQPSFCKWRLHCWFQRPLVTCSARVQATSAEHVFMFWTSACSRVEKVVHARALPSSCFSLIIIRYSRARSAVVVQHSCTTQQVFSPAVHHSCSTGSLPGYRCCLDHSGATLVTTPNLQQSVLFAPLHKHVLFYLTCVSRCARTMFDRAIIDACMQGDMNQCRRTVHHGAVKAGATQYAGCEQRTRA
jgi:hypothetical protein